MGLQTQRETLRDRVADLFRAQPGQWIDGLALAAVGGVYASRTRISECRRELGMRIENRVRAAQAGSKVRVSEYRYVSAAGL